MRFASSAVCVASSMMRWPRGSVAPTGVVYDNVPVDTSVAGIPVRQGTDMIEVRGVINSPLLGFDLATGCNSSSSACDPSAGCLPCVDSKNVNVAIKTLTEHVNDDAAQRIQFSQIDDYSAAAATKPMMVLVAFNDDIHTGCAFNIGAQVTPLYPQVPYNVGALNQATTLLVSRTFGSVNFTDAIAVEFNSETPAEAGTGARPEKNVRRAGILDDLVFFIDNSDPLHPALAQGSRRGATFDVVTLADDVEDMQIAYGVDLNGNNRIDDDEWSPDAPAKTPYVATDFQSQQPPPNPFTHPGAHCPRLHGVMVSLIAKSHDPDPTYKAPTASGIRIMNSPTTSPNPRTYPGYARYRRRLQTLRINLRNYAYEGS